MDSKERLYETFVDYILPYQNDYFRYIIRSVYDKDDANDILQTSYEQAWNNIYQLKDKEKAKNWMFTIITNNIRKYYNHKKKETMYILKEENVEAVLENIETDDDVLIFLIREFEENLALKALNNVKKEYADIIKLRFIEDKTIREIGKIKGLKEVSVRSKINRALKEYKKVYLKFEKEGERFE